MELMHVLLALQKGKTRATYGAVAGLLGGSARSIMKGRPRDPLHSWVVSKQTGMPSGYEEEQRHEDLLSNSRVIVDPEALEAYLEKH